MTSRRSVLKSIAAALFAPTIQLRQSIPNEQLLAAFCDIDPMYCYRFHLNEPFGVGSLTYATDGKAMARAEIANRLEIGERSLPKVAPIWQTYWHPDNNWRPLTPDDIAPTEIDPMLLTSCPECGGRRISLGQTYPDFSDPIIDADLYRRGYDVDDNSVYDPSCPTCRGQRFFGKSLYRFGEFHHPTHMSRRIVALPNVMACQSQYHPHAILFRAEGFEGISLGFSE